MKTTSHIGILDNLVTQFSSALDCFRELVQNSIDAGSSGVDVWTEYVGEAGLDGAIVVHVDDWGEGMDREVIDRQLTKLFSSTKRRDLTKIGKFGIGFVSVFALEPKAVIVRTGKNGQYWEIFFHADRTFQISALAEPVEGTQIAIVLEGDIYRYGELVEGVRQTLKFWCCHAEVEIGFEDRTPIDANLSQRELVNEAFEVGGLCAVRVDHPGTEMALAYNFEPTHSFYNRGLTLVAGNRGTESLGRRAERFGHISFKIKSRYFEHTLTREAIIQNEQFERGMGLLERAVEEQLFDALITKLEALVARSHWRIHDIDAHTRLLTVLMREPSALLEKAVNRPIIRLVDGRALTPAALYETWKRDGRVLLSESLSPLVKSLLTQGVPVIWGQPPSPEAAAAPDEPLLVKSFVRRCLDVQARRTLGGQVRALMGFNAESDRMRPIVAPEDVYIPITIDDEVPESLRAFLDATASLLSQARAEYRRMGTCQLSSFERENPLFVVSRRLGTTMARPPAGVVETQSSRRLEAAINRDHPHFRTLQAMYERSPEIAACLLARCLLLTHASAQIPGMQVISNAAQAQIDAALAAKSQPVEQR
ncbi:MAG: ATP-binding protein [Bradymonadaceae bacterium]|nr:ATP-binding protein [Lujinxingiaceae bacterium]